MKELIEKIKVQLQDNEWHSLSLGREEVKTLLNGIEKLSSLQSKGKTKEEVIWTDADIEEAFYDGGRKSNGQAAFNVVTWFPYFKQAKMNERREEYAQSHANKDGWVSVEDMKTLADEFMEKAKSLMNDADKNGNANSIQSISFNKEAAGWKYACYLLRDAIGLDRSTNKPLPPKPQI